MKPFAWFEAASLDEASKLLREHAGAAAVAGGVDLLGEMKEYLRAPTHLVSIRGLAGLDRIEKTGATWKIGATALVADLAAHEALRKDLPGLSEAALSVATPQIRNQATVGGNLLQRPRCWYWRHPDFNCAKKGGTGCPAIEGENRYHAIFGGPECPMVHPSDLAPMLIALNARLYLRGPDGARDLPLGDFYQLPAQNMTCEYTLRPGELIESVQVPTNQTRSLYLKIRERDSFDFALVSCAVAGLWDESNASASIVLGGVAPIPWRARASEAIFRGKDIEAIIARAAEVSTAGATPLSQNAWKIPLVQAVVARALRQYTGR